MLCNNQKKKFKFCDEYRSALIMKTLMLSEANCVKHDHNQKVILKRIDGHC